MIQNKCRVAACNTLGNQPFAQSYAAVKRKVTYIGRVIAALGTVKRDNVNRLSESLQAIDARVRIFAWIVCIEDAFSVLFDYIKERRGFWVMLRLDCGYGVALNLKAVVRLYLHCAQLVDARAVALDTVAYFCKAVRAGVNCKRWFVGNMRKPEHAHFKILRIKVVAVRVGYQAGFKPWHGHIIF